MPRYGSLLVIIVAACGPLVPVDETSGGSGGATHGATDGPTDGGDRGSSGWGPIADDTSSGGSSSSNGGQETGATAASGPSGDSNEADCGFSPNDPACGECLATNCCGAVSTCLADAACGCVLSCFDGFSPEALIPCLESCEVSQIPAGLAPIVECASTTCEACL